MIQIEVDFDCAAFLKEGWSYSIYGDEDLKEVLPRNMSRPLGGKSMNMPVFIDSDHAGDQVTCRSRNGFIVLLNLAPI